ncbi:alpha/beta hydrolase [Novosphingobium sp. SG720]|uniref:alpha/beta fold hydrolase n=1 Tax=Novosphingobium sp. SG720 TaxID=2586998 RepID=UPI0017B85FA7|nr:alpha/beta hydrolase [Novosphingobium sp. SG720]NKJ44290.1 pimeloyl-ACP methyl ester carboxylesterase [Novosphingobium sp. SG720]
MTDTPALPTIVLVHGAWADGSSWQRVIPLLLAEGLAVVAVPNPTTSLADDVAATARALAAIEGPVVLVGHSWGGAVITQAGNDPKVKALVYVAAFAPKAGETVGEQVGRYEAPPALGKIINDGAGFLTLSEAGWIEDVAQDLPEAEARVLCVVQPPLAASTFADKVDQAAWETRPCWYIVSAQDRIVSVALERELAVAMGAQTTELDAGHLSLLSQPAAVAGVILEAAAACAAAPTD